MGKFLNNVLKLIKPIKKIYQILDKIIPKRKQKNTEVEDLRNELKELKKQIGKHEKIISSKVEKLEEPKPIISKKKEKMIQAELYVTTVKSGVVGSSSGGYMLLNIPADEYEKIETQFNNMDTKLIKSKLGIKKDFVVKNVSHGFSDSSDQDSFIEINGTRTQYSRGLLD